MFTQFHWTTKLEQGVINVQRSPENLPATLRLYDLRHSCATLLLAANEIRE